MTPQVRLTALQSFLEPADYYGILMVSSHFSKRDFTCTVFYLPLEHV